MKIIFDLDHTLFDTRAFKRDIFHLLKKYGISEEAFRASYNEYVGARNLNYDLERHVLLLCKKYDINFSEIKAKIKDFLRASFTKYLRDDALSVLETLQQREHQLILITKGYPKFQRIKIKQSGLEDVFKNNIFVCKEKKEEILAKLDLSGTVYFINDQWHETERIKTQFPLLNYILYVRPDADEFYKSEMVSIPRVKDFKELLDFLP